MENEHGKMVEVLLSHSKDDQSRQSIGFYEIAERGPSCVLESVEIPDYVSIDEAFAIAEKRLAEINLAGPRNPTSPTDIRMCLECGGSEVGGLGIHHNPNCSRYASAPDPWESGPHCMHGMLLELGCGKCTQVSMEQALAGMRRGEQWRFEDWASGDYCSVHDPGGQYPHVYRVTSAGVLKPYAFSQAELLGLGWERI